ncbi:DMT family transporter [Parasedimentitalea maritima]|uniref:EamA family transporter n=1 Tax=Parasedimentitalea maritima TaxID=2578117 RepID=A0A6A4RFJ6_9RHOB|nr:DMT family transporter [Zongyanglinia marina]KAE9630017.1 EamA family transporter [Zongyanglinia marina]
MSSTTFLIVLGAAFLHAFWNAVVKGAGDKTIMLGMIALGHVVPGVILVMMYPSPGWGAVPYVIASTVIHWGYYFLLNVAYRLGDLSMIYPITRGLSPVLIALGAQFWVGETLPWLAWVGVFTISGGVLILTKGIVRGGIPLGGVLAAVGAAVIVASYSLVDGVGVRQADNAMGYIGWLYVSELAVAIFVFGTRWQRLRQIKAKTLVLGYLGGVLSGTAYGLVLYANTMAPLGVVSAVRETSVIFAAMIGVMWFGEGPKRRRLLAGVIVSLGIICIGLTK